MSITAGRSAAYQKRIENIRRKGADAFRSGLPESACPYEDHRQRTGKLTWSRAYRNDWVTGYRQARAEKGEGSSL